MSDTLILRLNFSGSAFAFGSAFPLGSVLAVSGLFLAGGWATDSEPTSKSATTRAADDAGRIGSGLRAGTTCRPLLDRVRGRPSIAGRELKVAVTPPIAGGPPR